MDIEHEDQGGVNALLPCGFSLTFEANQRIDVAPWTRRSSFRLQFSYFCQGQVGPFCM